MGNKRKSYYVSADKANKKAKLKFGNLVKMEANMKGFLLTYNCKFTFCINEAKKIIQQFSINPDNIEGSITKSGDQQTKPREECAGDMERELQKELDYLNSCDKELKLIDTGAKYTIFVNLENCRPNQVVNDMFEHVEKTRRPIGRYVQRILPVTSTCKAHLDDIDKCMRRVLDSELALLPLPCVPSVSTDTAETTIVAPPKPLTYCCIFKATNNGSLSKESVYQMAADYWQTRDMPVKVDFENPDYVIYVQVICTIGYVCFLKDFYKYRKYNLIEVGSKFNSASSGVSTGVGSIVKQASESKQERKGDEKDASEKESPEKESHTNTQLDASTENNENSEENTTTTTTTTVAVADN